MSIRICLVHVLFLGSWARVSGITRMCLMTSHRCFFLCPRLGSSPKLVAQQAQSRHQPSASQKKKIPLSRPTRHSPLFHKSDQQARECVRLGRGEKGASDLHAGAPAPAEEGIALHGKGSTSLVVRRSQKTPPQAVPDSTSPPPKAAQGASLHSL